MNYYAYSFLAGIFVGGYTNFFSKAIISGLVFYIFHPDHFHPRRFTPLYQTLKDNFEPYLVKVYTFANVKADTFANIKADTFTNVKADTFTNVKADTFANVKSDTFANVKADTFANVKADTFANVKSDTFANVKADTFTDLKQLKGNVVATTPTTPKLKITQK